MRRDKVLLAQKVPSCGFAGAWLLALPLRCARFAEEKRMLQDAISILVLVILPLLGIVVFRRLAKTKRQRRPVRTFRLK
jgi:hypothetical protein